MDQIKRIVALNPPLQILILFLKTVLVSGILLFIFSIYKYGWNPLDINLREVFILYKYLFSASFIAIYFKSRKDLTIDIFRKRNSSIKFSVAISVLIIALSIGLILLINRVESTTYTQPLLVELLFTCIDAIFLSFATALFEELIFRSVLFEILSAFINKYIVAILLSIVFGYLHIAHRIEDADFLFIMAYGLVAFTASIFLYLLYINFDVYACIVFHLLWNMLYNSFIITISTGNVPFGSIQVFLTEATIWNGFGFAELSLSNTLLFLISSIGMVIYNKNKKPSGI